MLKTVVSLCVFAVLATSTPVDAQTADRLTFFTFNQPITLPGVSLPPGTYQFRLPGINSSRNVVQVLDATGTRSYAMVLTVPADAPQAPADPTVQFMETPEGFPAALRAWWYPGSSTGYEFVYPREQALRLARASGTPVLTTADAADTVDEMRQAALTRVGAADASN